MRLLHRAALGSRKIKRAKMTLTESEQALKEMQSSHDAEVKARLELLRKIHCPPHVVVDFEQAIESMEKKNEDP